MLSSKLIFTTLLFALISFASFAGNPEFCLKCMEDVWSTDGKTRIYQNYRIYPKYDNGGQHIPYLDRYGKPIEGTRSNYVVDDKTDGYPMWSERLFIDANGTPRSIDTLFIESGAVLKLGSISLAPDKLFQNYTHDKKLIIYVKQGGKILFERASLKLTEDSQIIFESKNGNAVDNRKMVGYSWFADPMPGDFGMASPDADENNGRRKDNGNSENKPCPVSSITNQVDNSFIQLGEAPLDETEQYIWDICGLGKQETIIKREPTIGLPVKIISFEAKLSNNDIKLTWDVASEINFSHYVVQVSEDAHNFTNIGMVNQDNTQSGKKTYNYRYGNSNFNQLPDNTALYFRLKAVDLDGTVEYHKQAVVNVKTLQKLYTIRNNKLYLNYRVNTIYFYDFSGFIVKQIYNQSQLNLNGLNGLIVGGTINGQRFSGRIPVVK